MNSTEQEQIASAFANGSQYIMREDITREDKIIWLHQVARMLAQLTSKFLLADPAVLQTAQERFPDDKALASLGGKKIIIPNPRGITPGK